MRALSDASAALAAPQMAAHAREKLHCMEQERRQLEAKWVQGLGIWSLQCCAAEGLNFASCCSLALAAALNPGLPDAHNKAAQLSRGFSTAAQAGGG